MAKTAWKGQPVLMAIWMRRTRYEHSCPQLEQFGADGSHLSIS